MHLIPWSPLRDFGEMSKRLARLFDQPRTGESNHKEIVKMADWSPSVDISETDDAYHIDTDLPEVKKEDVNVTLDSGILIIQGERKGDQESTHRRKIHRKERSHGRFIRSFSVPDQVDDSQLNVELQEGVLRLHLPKSKKKVRT
jgi:HSP20 family protein